MTSPEAPAPSGENNQFREEAAAWFARMRGPDAEQHRAEFEQWLSSGALHRSAYNRISELWSMGKHLQEAGPAPQTKSNRRGSKWLAIAAAAAVPIGVAAWLHPLGFRSSEAPAQRVAAVSEASGLFAQNGSAPEAYLLPDGSSVRLSEGGSVRFTYDGRVRSLQLLRGVGRFEVAHETRAFIVNAGGGSVVAHGTIFIVSIAKSDVVNVRLIRGAIDVRMPRSTAPQGGEAVRSLLPGESVGFRIDSAAKASNLQTASAPVGATIEVSDEEISAVLDRANAAGGRPIVLADPHLGAMKVSGTFALGDHAHLASSLAQTFGMGVDARGDRILLTPTATKNSPPG